MIISASYKTDIPTFYGEWFANRLKAGYCKVVNPYNGRVSVVSLRRPDVDAFVFWTKNLGPFLPYLPHVHSNGFPFIVQYTINGYPRALESSVTEPTRAVAHVHEVRKTYGEGIVVWRYDTILMSSLTPPEFHLSNFASLAESMAGSVDEVVVSFAQLYRKTERKLQAAANESSFTWWEPSVDEKKRLLLELARIGRRWGIGLSLCSQPELLVDGAAEAQCVDTERISRVAGARVFAPLRGNRPGCRCSQSRDIGEYDTCPHGCVYCYAVSTNARAKERFRRHHPESEFLFQPSHPTTEAQRSLPLFSGDNEH